MIKELITQYAPSLKVPDTLNAEALLWAIYRCEKYGAFNRVPRFEAAYAPGGRYYETVARVRELHKTWGDYAACSFSNFQILYVTATELGYVGPPLALDKDEIALPFICKLLNTRILGKGATSVEDVADAYNSGNFKDANKPWKYIKRFSTFYDLALKEIARELRQSNPAPHPPSIVPGEGSQPGPPGEGTGS